MSAAGRRCPDLRNPHGRERQIPVAPGDLRGAQRPPSRYQPATAVHIVTTARLAPSGCGVPKSPRSAPLTTTWSKSRCCRSRFSTIPVKATPRGCGEPSTPRSSPPVARREQDVGLDDRPELIRGAAGRAGERLLGQADQVVHGPAHEIEEDVQVLREVVVEAGNADAGCACDIADGRSVEPVLEKGDQRCLSDQVGARCGDHAGSIPARSRSATSARRPVLLRAAPSAGPRTSTRRLRGPEPAPGSERREPRSSV